MTINASFSNQIYPVGMQIDQGYFVNVTCVQDFKLEQQCVLHLGSAHIVDTIKRGACIAFNCYP